MLTQCSAHGESFANEPGRRPPPLPCRRTPCRRLPPPPPGGVTASGQGGCRGWCGTTRAAPPA